MTAPGKEPMSQTETQPSTGPDDRPAVDLHDPPVQPPAPSNGALTPTPTQPPSVSAAVPADVRPVGRVGAPRGAEATSDTFSVWVADDEVVEKTQLVRADTEVGGRPVHMYGLVSEVSRRSRRADILEESDRYDNDPAESVPTSPGGVTFAQVRVLGSQPVLLAPPREESPVFAADTTDVAAAYSMNDMAAPITVGLVRNGGEATAGPARIDLDYLLGALGGHCNVGGMAGVGTKSSFLTILASQVQQTLAGRRAQGTSEAQARVVILNVKGFDLFWLDHWSRSFDQTDVAMWADMGVTDPRPLSVTFHAPQAPGSEQLAIPTGRQDVAPYSWSLADIAAGDLFGYLFGDSERDDDNFALLLGDLERVLVQERTAADGRVLRSLRSDGPAGSFRDLLAWVEQGVNGDDPPGWSSFARGSHHSGTLRRFHRRLRRIVYESAGIFRLDSGGSHPLDITQLDPTRPAVIDIQSLTDAHHQRFVVAALLNQAVSDQTGPGAVRGMHYLFVLDELNRFAPAGKATQSPN